MRKRYWMILNGTHRRWLRNWANAGRAARLRLYGLVAHMARSITPRSRLHRCPVCERDLTTPGAVPTDALLDKSVAQALEDARHSDKTMLKTAAEWERDSKHSLRDRIPEKLRRFIDEAGPDDLASVYKSALAREVFQSPDFPHLLKPMATAVDGLCKAAWSKAPIREPLPGVTLPEEIPDNESLRAAIRGVRRAIALSRYRAAHAEFARAAILTVIRTDDDEAAIVANETLPSKASSGVAKPLGDRDYVRRHPATAGANQDSCEHWVKARTRIEKLARAAKAVEPFKEFPTSSTIRFAGLITDLQEKATAWSGACIGLTSSKRRICRSRFRQKRRIQVPSGAGKTFGRKRIM